MTYEQAQELKRGDEVWYIDNDGERHEATALAWDDGSVIIEYNEWHGPVIVRCDPSEVEL